DGSALAASAVACTGGTVALNLSGQPAGTYTVMVTAVDAGVSTAGSRTLTYTLYPPAPTLAAGPNPANQTGVADDAAGTGPSPSGRTRPTRPASRTTSRARAGRRCGP